MNYILLYAIILPLLFQLPEGTIVQETEDELQHTLDEPVSFFLLLL